MSLDNVAIAEHLAHAGEQVQDYKQRAYWRAARGALAWPEEATELVAESRSLTELYAVGGGLARRLREWIEDPPTLNWEVPESRTGFSSLAVGRAIVRAHPQWRRDLQADLQMHSTYSDGTVSIESMARAGHELGHRYVAITDHSQGLTVAGGMSPERLGIQALEIAELNEQLADDGMRVLHGLEMNLDLEGAGDMEADDLAPLDLVLGSFHSKLRRKEDQTERYVAALRNPHIHVLGHPRGRMYNARGGLHANWRVVFAEAQRQRVAVEIDCNPNRQDLNAELAALAAEAGCHVSIGTDAHSTHELTFIELGVATVLAAGVPRERILNYMTADDLVAWARAR